MLDENGDGILCKGTTVPAATTAGYAKGCIFIKTNGTAGTIYYINEGSNTSCAFRTVDLSTATAQIGTIATTSATSAFAICPKAGTVVGIDFTGKDALAANDTNYITFTAVNRGQAGAGTTDLLAATDPNTTKATGGTALAAKGKRSLTLHGTAGNLAVVAGDVIEIIATATGTLANTVTLSAAIVKIA